MDEEVCLAGLVAVPGLPPTAPCPAAPVRLLGVLSGRGRVAPGEARSLSGKGSAGEAPCCGGSGPKGGRPAPPAPSAADMS